MATVDDITQEELKLVGAMRGLRVKPEGVETRADLEKFMKDYDKESHTEKRQLPRLSIFFGEEGKGEVVYQTWKYEIECLVQEGKYAEEQILMAIRRAAKGEAANILRRLGTKARIVDILKKLTALLEILTLQKLFSKNFMPLNRNHLNH